MGTVVDYVQTVDLGRRAAVSAIVDHVRAYVPDATEGVSYGMPAFIYRGQPLLAVRAAKTHLAVYPFSGSVVDLVADQLVGYSLSRGTIRFTEDRPLPDGVLASILDLRIREIEQASDERGARRGPSKPKSTRRGPSL